MKQYTVIEHAVYQGLKFEHKGYKTYIDFTNDRVAYVDPKNLRVKWLALPYENIGPYILDDRGTIWANCSLDRGFPSHELQTDLIANRAAFVCIDPSREIYYDYMTNQWEEIIKN